MRGLLLPLLVLPALALAAPAGANTVSYHNIVSPTKQISCSAVIGSTEIECTAPYLPDIGDLDTYVALRKHGRSRLSERGDFPGFSDRRRTLHYGDTWKRPGISCQMRRTGLTCRNADDHGFHLQSPVLRF